MAWTVRLYRTAFSNRYLLLTNTVVSVVVDGLGDVIEQKLERTCPYDWPRTLRMAATGLFLGPISHYWYRWLDRVLPGKGTVTIAKKITLEQFTIAPAEIASFYCGTSTYWCRKIVWLLQQGSKQDYIGRLRLVALSMS